MKKKIRRVESQNIKTEITTAIFVTGASTDTQTRYCFGCAYRLGSAYKRKSQCAYVFYVFACGVKALRPDAGLAFESCGNHCDAHERCENERNSRLPRSDREWYARQTTVVILSLTMWDFHTTAAKPYLRTCHLQQSRAR